MANRKENMPEIIGGVGKAVGGAVKAVAPAVVRAPMTTIAPVARVGPMAANIRQEVAAGLGALKELAPIKPGAKVINNASPFIAKADRIAASGDGHKALSFLAFGETKSRFTENVAAKLPQGVLRHDFVTLEKLGPEGTKGLANDVARMQLPQNVLNDPVFTQNFFDEFKKDIALKKELLKNGELTAEEYMQGREQMVRESAQKAMNKQERGDTPTEQDLEELKRKAAMDAIRQHMNMWRQSVMADKRLIPEAKQRALMRINNLERRLLVKESMKWDGLSIMKMLAIAATYMAETAS